MDYNSIQWHIIGVCVFYLMIYGLLVYTDLIYHSISLIMRDKLF